MSTPSSRELVSSSKSRLFNYIGVVTALALLIYISIKKVLMLTVRWHFGCKLVTLVTLNEQPQSPDVSNFIQVEFVITGG